MSPLGRGLFCPVKLLGYNGTGLLYFPALVFTQSAQLTNSRCHPRTVKLKHACDLALVATGLAASLPQLPLPIIAIVFFKLHDLRHRHCWKAHDHQQMALPMMTPIAPPSACARDMQNIEDKRIPYFNCTNYAARYHPT